MIENFVLVLVLIGIGTLARRINLLPLNTSEVLNRFVLNISLPAMILVSIPNLVLSKEALYPVVFHWGLYALNITLILLAYKILKFKNSILGVLLIVSPLGNTAFLGLPIVSAFFGEEALAYGVLYDQLGSGLAFIFTAGIILPRFIGDKKQKKVSEVFLGLIKFPPFIALVIGFLCIFLEVPVLMNLICSKISSTLVPCAMIAVGFQMKYKLNISEVKPLVLGLGIKLFLIPTAGLLVIKLCSLNTLSAYTAVIQSGMPPMITAGAMAMQVKLEESTAASLVGYGIFISFLTLPLIKFLI